MHEKMIDWLNSIQDYNLHHLGEFYTYLMHKPWRTPKGHRKAEFMAWYPVELPKYIDFPFTPKYFVVLRDWDGTDFVQRKEAGRIYKDQDDWFAFNCKGCREFFFCSAMFMEQQYQLGTLCHKRVPEYGGNYKEICPGSVNND